MGIKRKIKHAIKREKEIVFMVDHHKVVKKEDYICNDERYGYGPAKYVKCPKESRIKATIYATSTIQTFDEIRVNYMIYAFPVISKKKWAFYIHSSGGGETYDWNSIKDYDIKYYDTPEKAIGAGLWFTALLEH